MRAIRGALVLATLLAAVSAHADSIVLETFPADTSFGTSFWVMDSDSFVGIRFTLTEATYVSHVSAFLSGSTNATIFAAIDSLASATALPDVLHGFDPDDMLGYGTATFPGIFVYEDVSFEIGALLDPGSYVLFFGGINDAGGGGAPWSQDLGASTIPLTDYLEYSGSEGWFEFSSLGLRAVIVTPEPGTALLTAIGLAALAGHASRRRRRSVR